MNEKRRKQGKNHFLSHLLLTIALLGLTGIGYKIYNLNQTKRVLADLYTELTADHHE
jgi:hypothetical protein